MFTLPYYYFRTSFYGYGKNLTLGIYEGTKYEGNR